MYSKENKQTDHIVNNHLWQFVSIVTIIIAATSGLLFFATQQYVLKQAENRIEDLLMAHKGIHQYVQNVMHPAFYKYIEEGKIQENFYAPELLSSSFIARNQHFFYNEERVATGLPELYYKLAANNPRNPVNIADAREEKLIKMFNKQKNIKKYREIIQIDNKKYLFVALPFLENQKKCMKCHGKRENAPKQLQERYKGQGGFNEKPGEIRAIISFRAPLDNEYSTTYIIFSALLAGLITIFSLFLFNSRLKRLVYKRTKSLEQEIIDRKKAEEELKENESFLDSIIENIPNTVFIKDAHSLNFVRLNLAGEELLGFQREDFIGKNVYDFFPKEDADFFTEKDRMVLKDKKLVDIPEETVQTKGKGRRILHTKKIPILDKSGEPIFLLGIAEDITSRKQADETFQAIVQSSVGRTGQDFFDNICNQLCKVFNSECAIVSELTDATNLNAIAMVLDGAPIKEFSYQSPGTPCENVMTNGFCHYSEDVCVLFPDDKDLQNMEAVGYAGVPLRNQNGTVNGVLCILSKNKMMLPERAEDLMKILAARVSAEIERMEITRDKEKLESRLQQAQKLEAIGTLAGGIAHDFNNILGAILGYAEMAKDDSPPGSTVATDLNQVLEAGNRAKGLVKQILAFSRMANTECIPLQPASVVKEAIEMLRPTLPTTIEINQDIDSTTGIIFADPTQISQILMNLCTNAFHAMEETGGRLDISLKETDLSAEDLVNEPDIKAGTFVQLSICDSGPGIAPELKEKIFDPYFTTKETGKGTGMGLSIVHGIVKSYGGFISLHSVLGEGTAFHLFLPVIDKELVPKIEAVDLIPIGKERILFIDDEEILTEMGRDMLERLGYHVTARNSSLEALETFQNQPDQFDIVITDQTMPGMTGADLARRMMQIRPDIPIIICTGYSTIFSEEKAKAMGVKEFALKPLAKRDLAHLIRKVLDA